MTDQKRIEGRKLAEAAAVGGAASGEPGWFWADQFAAHPDPDGSFIAHHDPYYVRELYDALDAAEAEATDLDEDRVFAIVWAMKAEEDLELVSGELQRWINRGHEAKQEAKRERARADKAEADLDERDRGVAAIAEINAKLREALDEAQHHAEVVGNLYRAAQCERDEARAEVERAEAERGQG